MQQPFKIDRSNNNIGIGVTNPAKDLDVSGDIQASNEVYSGICSSIGTLGFILLDTISLSDPAGDNFTTTLNLDNQSTANFAVYRLIVRGYFDHNNTSLPNISYRLFDNGTVISSSSYNYSIWEGNGSLMGSSDAATSGVLLYSELDTSATDTYYSGSFDICLSATAEEVNIQGLYGTRRADGNNNFRRSGSVITGLNSSLSITKITAISFDGTNCDTASYFRARVYRML